MSLLSLKSFANAKDGREKSKVFYYVLFVIMYTILKLSFLNNEMRFVEISTITEVRHFENW